MAYLRLILVAACPVAITVVLYLWNGKTAPAGRKSWARQVLFGLIFGAAAIFGSEFGVPIDGTIINVRDASPLCAGLIFGPPAGIIAGVIGGLERWFAVLWGAGTYTRLACSVSTVLAGCFAAVLRKWMFDNKTPSWQYGFAIGMVTEVFHMLMVFFTNMSDVRVAFGFVRQCAAPMILVNGCAVMCAVALVSLPSRRERKSLDREHRQLTQTFSKWLLAVVLVAFCATSLFTWFLQTSSAEDSNRQLLTLNLDDVKRDILDASDANLLELTRGVAADLNDAGTINSSILSAIRRKPGNDFSEINVVDAQGIITWSTTPAYPGFHMASGEQSREFLVLLDTQTEYVQSYQPVAKDGETYMKYAGVALEGGGFVQVGYNAARFRRDIDQRVVGATRNRHVGENGYLIIAAEDRTIVSGPQGDEGKDLSVSAGIRLDPSATAEYTRFESMAYGEQCYCMYTVTEGYYIVAVTPARDVVFSRDLSVFITVFMEILVFAALFVLVYLLIKKLVVENIHEINHSLREITGGNLDVSVNVRTNEEFVSLSDDINSTVLTLKGYIAQAAARLDKELEVAKVIQSSTLPSVFPPYPQRTDFDIFAQMDTAREVGGDFYDFYLLDDDRLAFLIADVSGKGITAAMFMMKAKTLIKSYAEKESDVAAILTHANQALCEGNDAEMFVTCWMGILRFSTHTVSFANAGHNPPLVRRKGGQFEYFKSRPGFVLGGMEGIRYRSGELELNPGDEIFLYTDGVTEANDKDNALYGEDRLLAALNALGDVDAQTICRRVRADVDAFVGQADQFDDITMLHLRLLPQNVLELSPVLAELDRATAFVEDTLQAEGVDRKIVVKMNIAVDEIFSNIARYSGAGKARVECAVTPERVMVRFVDNGKPYDPTQQAEPDTTLSAEERDIGGLGILMVKKSMDGVEYTYENGQNILSLWKNR